MIEGGNELMNYLKSLPKFDRFKALKKAKPIVERDNREGLLGGLDADGHPFPAPKAGAAQRGGDGPYLVPRGAASRAIANLDVTVSGSELSMSWSDADFMQFFNAAGVRPQGMNRVIDAITQDVVRQIEGK